MFHPPLTSEDMRRLYDECRMGVDDANSLSRTLLTATPEQLKAKALIVEELRENCIASQNLISSQISRASASAERRRAAKNQAMRTTSGSRSLPYASTRQEKLLAELLASNEQLLEALKLYDDLQRVALEAKVDVRHYHMNSDGLVWAEEEFVTHARVARLEPAAAYWPSPVHSQVQKPFAPHGPRLRSNYGPPLR
ncbi:hypothetical protein K438DRAFT_1134555 [Mycena galopus ATCC 62051]|nr:hypothetical protein K438DRAFT_1134555 [Mycena galopus ATCC 62051]